MQSNDQIDISLWKRIFLGYVCKNPEYCLDKNKFTNNCWQCIKSHSKWCEKNLSVDDKDITLVPYGENNEYKSDIDCSVALRKHPLVDSGIAYWSTYDTLLIGYNLKNTDVWRPVFSRKREKLLCKVRHSIKKYMAKRELSRITKLYNDVIILICDYL